MEALVNKIIPKNPFVQLNFLIKSTGLNNLIFREHMKKIFLFICAANMITMSMQAMLCCCPCNFLCQRKEREVIKNYLRVDLSTQQYAALNKTQKNYLYSWGQEMRAVESLRRRVKTTHTDFNNLGLPAQIADQFQPFVARNIELQKDIEKVEKKD